MKKIFCLAMPLALVAACGASSDVSSDAQAGSGGAVGSGGSGGNGGQGSGGATCGSTSGTGGFHALGTIGKAVQAFGLVNIWVNRNDGFASPSRTDWWSINVGDATVTLNGGAPVKASTAQVQSLVTALSSAAFHDRPACCVYQFIDGMPNAPIIAVGDGDPVKFGVGDNPCWLSANAYEGNVISCADFGIIFGILESIAPSGEPFKCYDYF